MINCVSSLILILCVVYIFSFNWQHPCSKRRKKPCLMRWLQRLQMCAGTSALPVPLVANSALANQLAFQNVLSDTWTWASPLWTASNPWDNVEYFPDTQIIILASPPIFTIWLSESLKPIDLVRRFCLYSTET